MKLPIYIYGTPVLREVAQDVELNREVLVPLVQDMFDTLDASNGIGLAAPQIGKPIRVVVIDLNVLSDDLPEYKAHWEEKEKWYKKNFPGKLITTYEGNDLSKVAMKIIKEYR